MLSLPGLRDGDDGCGIFMIRGRRLYFPFSRRQIRAGHRFREWSPVFRRLFCLYGLRRPNMCDQGRWRQQDKKRQGDCAEV